MIEFLKFIFSDPIYFLGVTAMLLIIVWGIANFTLVRINISNYHVLPGSFSETEVADDEM